MGFNRNSNEAKGLLRHYFETAIGDSFGGDCPTEVDSIVDLIISAAKDEILPELQKLKKDSNLEAMVQEAVVESADRQVGQMIEKWLDGFLTERNDLLMGMMTPVIEGRVERWLNDNEPRINQILLLGVNNWINDNLEALIPVITKKITAITEQLIREREGGNRG